jgi:hypothetical protein
VPCRVFPIPLLCAKTATLVEAQNLRAAQLALSPSAAAVISTFRDEQRTRPVLNCRPADLFGPPVGLFHPVFNTFCTLMTSPNSSRDGDNLYHTIKIFLNACAGLYENENMRIKAIENSFRTLLGCPYFVYKAQGTESDGVIVEICGGNNAYCVIIEVKNEIGTGHADPYNQGSLAYRKYWTDNKCKCGKCTCVFTYLSYVFNSESHKKGVLLPNYRPGNSRPVVMCSWWYSQ